MSVDWNPRHWTPKRRRRALIALVLVWDAAGRVYSSPKQSLMALVVGGQAVSLGVANMGDGLTLRPFAKTDWLNSRLAEFPKPLVQMTPDKP